MFENITHMLMILSNYMDFTELITKEMLNLAQKGEIDKLCEQVDNRDRLIKIIAKFNTAIERKLDELPVQEKKLLKSTLLDSWGQDLENWKKRMVELDQIVSSNLENLKKETKSELKAVFTNKNKLVGYNLRSTK